MSYVHQDSMSLWWLADPLAPQRIGTLSLQDQRRKVVFKSLKVRNVDIELLAQYLDGAHLRAQRRLF